LKLVNLDTGEILADQVLQAYSFAKRLKGLMFTRSLASGACLHIKPCRSIHTFFMNYPIDVLHLDASNRVVGIEANVQPGKVGAAYPHSVSVVELPAGRIEQAKTKIGQTVHFKPKGEIYDDEQN